MNGIYISKDIIDKGMKYLWFIFFAGFTAFNRIIPGINSISVKLLIIVTVLFIIQQYYNDNILVIKTMPTISLAILVFYIYIYMSKGWGFYSNNETSIVRFYIELILPMVFCMELYVTTRERLNSVLKAFVLAITLFAVVATVTTPVSLWGDAKLYGGITGYQRNLASMIFVIGFAVCIYFITEFKAKLYYVCAAILFVANLITGSRKGIIQTFLSIGLFFLLSGTFKDKIKYLRIIIIVGLIAVIAFMNIPWLQETFGQRMLAVFDDSIEDGSKEFRKIYRGLALLAFLDRPILGNGLDAFCVINEKITGMKLYSHCNFTELLCDYGIVGFIIYYFNYIRFLITGFIHRKDKLALLAVYSVLPVLVIEYGQITYYQPVPQVIFVMLFLCAKIAMAEESDKKVQEN